MKSRLHFYRTFSVKGYFSFQLHSLIQDFSSHRYLHPDLLGGEDCDGAVMTQIDLNTFYISTVRLTDLDSYIQEAKELAGEGNDVVLTGAAPVWLYLKIAHALHGKARKLIYRSPVTEDVVIFDHSPF